MKSGSILPALTRRATGKFHVLRETTSEGFGERFESRLRAGGQIQTHAIGGRGHRVVLDLYEKAFAAVPLSERKIAGPRWRIEHAQDPMGGTHPIARLDPSLRSG